MTRYIDYGRMSIKNLEISESQEISDYMPSPPLVGTGASRQRFQKGITM
jgi:hypothetical protein